MLFPIDWCSCFIFEVVFLLILLNVIYEECLILLHLTQILTRTKSLWGHWDLTKLKNPYTHYDIISHKCLNRKEIKWSDDISYAKGQGSTSLWNHTILWKLFFWGIFFWIIQHHNSEPEGSIVTIFQVGSDTAGVINLGCLPWNSADCTDVLRCLAEHVCEASTIFLKISFQHHIWNIAYCHCYNFAFF